MAGFDLCPRGEPVALLQKGSSGARQVVERAPMLGSAGSHSNLNGKRVTIRSFRVHRPPGSSAFLIETSVVKPPASQDPLLATLKPRLKARGLTCNGDVLVRCDAPTCRAWTFSAAAALRRS